MQGLRIGDRGLAAGLPVPGSVLAVCMLLCGAPAAAAETYTLTRALREAHDLSLLREAAQPPRDVVSTQGRAEFLRREGPERVLLDVRGPGVFLALRADKPQGFLRFRFDGAEEPQFACLWEDLATGKLPPIEAPFVTPDGDVLFPMPFASGLKVTLAGETAVDWSATAAVFPADATAESWWPGKKPPAGTIEEYRRAAKAWESPGAQSPAGDVVWSGEASIFAGEAWSWRAPRDLTVTEVALERWTQSGDVGTLAGIPMPPGGASIGMGEIGTRGWMRRPIALRAGEELAWRIDDADAEWAGRIAVRAVEGAAPDSGGVFDGLISGAPPGWANRRLSTATALSAVPFGTIVAGDPPLVQRAPTALAAAVADADGLSGSATLSVGDGTSWLSIHLDLPLGWRGSLEAAGQKKEPVFDIGWPPIEFAPAPGELGVAWRIIESPAHAMGPTFAQLRIDVSYADGRRDTIAVPITISAAGRAPVAEWKRADAKGGRLALPAGLRGEPGDVLEIRGGNGAHCLRYGPVSGTANGAGFDDAFTEELPDDGTACADASGGRAHVPLGSLQSWIGTPEWIAIEGSFSGAALFRRPELPKPEGWSRRVPYIENGLRFEVPRHRLMLAGLDLGEALDVAGALPHDTIRPERWPADFLENVEAGPLGWRLADPPDRTGSIPPADVFVFEGTRTGERLVLRHPKIAGERFFGIQFGFGPQGATVAIRDCEGRLIAVQDTFMPRDRVFPQWTWFALPVPSRDGWLFLETLGPAPGSASQHIAVQKFMVVEEKY